MRARTQILQLAAAAVLCAALAFPAASFGEYYVPPGNSAANQYTETLPGAGGNSGGKHKGATPADTLGAGNAKKLEKQGPDGKATAELAAETAPVQLAGNGGSGGQSTGAGNGNGGGQSAGGSGASSGSGSGQAGLGGATKVAEPQGSSALGQVVGQATGAGDGNLGLWLPLAILLILVGSIAYWVRTRQGHPA